MRNPIQAHDTNLHVNYFSKLFFLFRKAIFHSLSKSVVYFFIFDLSLIVSLLSGSAHFCKDFFIIGLAGYLVMNQSCEARRFINIFIAWHLHY
jgi:hypothetical protein